MLTLEEESRLRELENRPLRRIFAPKRDEVTGYKKNYTSQNFRICTTRQIILE
jgi:hypothetical protein